MKADPVNLPLQVLGQFRIVFKSINRHFDTLEKSTGISGPQIWALAEIEAHPGMTIGDLTRLMSLHQSTTSNLLDRLEKNRMIRKVTAPEDRRVTRLSITPKGQAVLQRSQGPHRGLLPEALLSMEETDLVQLREAMDRLIHELEHKTVQDAKRPLRDI